MTDNVVKMFPSPSDFPEHPNNPTLHSMLVAELIDTKKDIALLQSQILVLLKKKSNIEELLNGKLPDPSVGVWSKSTERGTCRECGRGTRSVHPKGWYQHLVCPEEKVSSKRTTPGIPAEVWKVLFDEQED